MNNLASYIVYCTVVTLAWLLLGLLGWLIMLHTYKWYAPVHRAWLEKYKLSAIEDDYGQVMHSLGFCLVLGIVAPVIALMDADEKHRLRRD